MKITEFKLERYFAQHEFSVPYLLGSSDSESFTIQEILDLEPGAAEAFNKHWLGYTEYDGNPELRSQVSNLYEDINPSQVSICAGAQEAIFAFANTMLGPGDHMIVQFPAYQSLYQVAQDAGCEITNWPMNPDDNWELDLQFIKDHIRPETKVILINMPNNPTGYLASKRWQQELVAIADKHGIFIFSDEVYRWLEHNEEDRLPAMADIYDKGISLGVMSKTFGLPGLRIGWLAMKNTELFNQISAFKDYTSICNSAPSELLSIVGLRNKEKLIARNLGIVNNNLAMLDQFFIKHEGVMSWVKPKAGAISFPKLNSGINASDFSKQLIDKNGVMIVPGELYFYNNQYFRLGFGRKNMPEALDMVDSLLDEISH